MLGLLDCFLLKSQFAVQSLNQVDLITEGILYFEALFSFNLDLTINQVDAFDALVICLLEYLNSAYKFGKRTAALSRVKSIDKFFFYHCGKVISKLSFITDPLHFAAYIHLYIVKP